MRRIIKDMHMAEVTTCYGMTETSPVSTQTSTNDIIEHRSSTVGRVHPYVEIKIIEPATGECEDRGVVGELCIRGYSVMLGYWNHPERTAQAIDGAGWLHTGDLAIMAEDGYLTIAGRSSDIIIKGGVNIYPREIEKFLYNHPDVSDVVVIGVPDERYGEEVMAWIVLHHGANMTEEDIREFCRGGIAHYKIPRYVKVVDSFPMSVTGKVQKYKMRGEAIESVERAARSWMGDETA
jgi:fatty-acyl-CoA synthase